MDGNPSQTPEHSSSSEDSKGWENARYRNETPGGPAVEVNVKPQGRGDQIELLRGLKENRPYEEPKFVPSRGTATEPCT